MTCLYECIYLALEERGREDALEVITSSLGFSIEAHIPSRSWLLCGQSDIEYYAPKLNRNVEAEWIPLPPSEITSLVLEGKAQKSPLILETESRLIPYYNQSALGIGMPHAFLIFDYDPQRKGFLIFDRLAAEGLFPKDEKGRFWVDSDILQPAFQSKLYYLRICCNSPDKDWEEELHRLCEESVYNMKREVPRDQLNFQAFGFQGLSVFSSAFRHFREAYWDDAQSIWLINHYLPINIFQSVYGNRFLFRRAIKNSPSPHYQPFLEALDLSMGAWSRLRQGMVDCSEGKLTYGEVADRVDQVALVEKTVIDLCLKIVDTCST